MQGVALARQLPSTCGTTTLDMLLFVQARIWGSAPAVHPACRAPPTQPVHLLAAAQRSVAGQDALSFIALMIPLCKKGMLALCKGGVLDGGLVPSASGRPPALHSAQP